MVDWKSIQGTAKEQYTCGHCQLPVASFLGWGATDPNHKIQICPNCEKPTYFFVDEQLPRVKLGSSVEYLPESIETVFEEARSCTEHACYTAAVMLCRKLLMNIAVDHKAEEGESFANYVKYLASEHLVPPGLELALEKVRNLGNEANHVVVQRTKAEAQMLLDFLGIVLRTNYEFPQKLLNHTDASESSD